MKKVFFAILFAAIGLLLPAVNAVAAEEVQVVRNRRVYVYDSGELVEALARDDVKSIVIASKVKNNVIIVPEGEYPQLELVIGKNSKCKVVIDFEKTKFDSFTSNDKNKNIFHPDEAVEKGLIDAPKSKKAEEIQVVKEKNGKFVVSYIKAPAEKTVITKTVTPTVTVTPTPEATATPTPTSEPVYVPTATPTPTYYYSEPTNTPIYVPTATPTPTSEPVYVPTATPEPTSEPVYVPTATPEPTSAPLIEDLSDQGYNYTPTPEPQPEAGEIVSGNQFMVSDDGQYYYAVGEGVPKNIVENATFENSWVEYSKSEGGNLDIGVLAWNDAQGIQGTTVEDSSSSESSLGVTNNGDRITFSEEELQNLAPGTYEIYVWFDEDSANKVRIIVTE